MACAMRLIRGRLVEARRCRADIAEDCRAVSEVLSRVGDKCTVLVVWTPGPSRTHRIVRFRTIADKDGFWPAEVCPFMTQSGHELSRTPVVGAVRVTFMPLRAIPSPQMFVLKLTPDLRQ